MLKKILSAPLKIFNLARGKGIDFEKLPQKPKSFPNRLTDILLWLLRYGEIPHYYYIYGFEAKSRKEQNNYIANYKFYKLVDKANKILINSYAEEELDYKIVTMDKYVANNYLESIAVPAVHNEALIRNNTVFWSKGGEGRLSSLLQADYDSIYIKPVFGQSGKDILRLEIVAGAFFHMGEKLPGEDLEKKLEGKMWVVQRRVKQHKGLDKFNSSATNTLRIISILVNGKPELLSSSLRISIGNSYVDNWDKGSLLVGVNHAKGTLLEKGFFTPKGHVAETCVLHPDSQQAFHNFKIPFYFEAKETALRAHRFFPSRFIVATDCAISDEGPVIIEMNSAPDLRFIQLFRSDTKSKIHEAMRCLEGPKQLGKN